MREVGVIMAAWESRVKRYGEDEKTAKDRARGLGENVVEHRTHSQPSANILDGNSLRTASVVVSCHQ